MAENAYPSVTAMKAAVELEIHAALGSVQTAAIGRMIQSAIDAAVKDCARLAERFSDQGRDGHQIAAALRADEYCPQDSITGGGNG